MLAKLAYGLVFCLAVPALLVWWARELDAKLGALPRLHSWPVGGALAALGGALLLRAMWDLFRKGGGLPMNAFPPPRFVVSGAYRIVPHPIYVGFGVLTLGVAVACGSAGGLWVVTPVTWLAMIALVLGYERIDLHRRFGPSPTRSWLSLPAAMPSPPPFRERAAAAVMAFGPWLLGYEAARLLTGPFNTLDTMLPFERHWPVIEPLGVAYLGAYAWTALAPFAARTSAELRRFVCTACWGTGFILWCFFVLPLQATPRALDTGPWFGRALAMDRQLDTAACAFPSFHIFWAFVAADLWSARLGRWLSYAVASVIAVSCLATGAHSVLDVVAGWLAYFGARHSDLVWRGLRQAAEYTANSWRDWRLGSVRIINHGGYVAAATTLGLWLVGLLLGSEHALEIVVVALFALVGAGAWGQWLEASSQLSRPFGYFGGLFGGCLGFLAVELWWGEGWLLAGGFAVAAPVIQAVGRLRCLVQGCCHGRPTALDWLGIRYHRPLSRVCKLARLDGVPLHPTPLYSTIANILILGLLLRLWHERAETGLIVGAYLLLSTCARFMEEGYRGEPQTARFAGLPIYQWLALGCFLAGVALTSLATPRVPAISGFDYRALLAGLPVGLLLWFAMGVDFPESSRRMSRLA